MRTLQLLFLFLLLSRVSHAQIGQDTLSAIEKAVSKYQSSSPGCQLSISRNGQVIFSKAWGMADLERNIPLSTNSVLEAGSVSKQFVAASILLLEQQGKLSLDDDVRKYIPELPVYQSPIRLRQMLHHTSGLRDWGAIAELTGWPRSTRFYSNEDALEILARQQHLNHKPGAEFLYSNSNYNLFAIIVQRVSGLTLAAFTKKFIFQPAGMTHTEWRDDPNRIVHNRAIAYERSDSGVFTIDMPNEYVYGNGGLLTTTEDLLKWNNFYQQGKLGSPSLFPKQILTEPLNNGVMNPYAAGLFVQKVMGWDNISHSGATAGYRAYLQTFPQSGLSFAVLSNNGSVNVVQVAMTVSRIFVPDQSDKKVNTATGVSLPEEKLNAFAGVYRNERDGSTFVFAIKEKKIILDNYTTLTITSQNTLASTNFHFEINGAKGWLITNAPADTIPVTRVEPVNPSQIDHHRYTGKYFSEETNSTLVISDDNGKLMLHLKPNADYPLISTYKDAFVVHAVDDLDLRFIGDSGNKVNNKIIGLSISLDRARNVEFKKTSP